MTKQHRYRDATSGEFVTDDYAAAHPDTTVSETIDAPEDDTVTEAMVEAGANEMYDHTWTSGENWFDLYEVERRMWRDAFRAALEAALAVKQGKR